MLGGVVETYKSFLSEGFFWSMKMVSSIM
jgi:hypothetical protein